MAPAIPDRWLNYKPVGKRIEGTRFIAFKVPLREHVVKEIKEDNRLDADGLLQNIPNLGLIIDLTNTNRYYDPEFFRKAGVEHKKLMIPGHFTPSEHLVNKFKLYVLNFLNNNKDNDKLIGVHCTHGVNRTGYLICHYMISELTLNPKDAIERFDAARGHQIERLNYLGALQELANSRAISAEKSISRALDSDRVNDRSNHRNSHERRQHDRREDFYHRTDNRVIRHKPRHTNNSHNLQSSLEEYSRNNPFAQNPNQGDERNHHSVPQQSRYTQQHSHGLHSQTNDRPNSMSQRYNFSNDRNHQRAMPQNHRQIQPSHSYRQNNQTSAAESYGDYRRRQHGSTPYSIDHRPNRFGSDRDGAAYQRTHNNAAPNYNSNYSRTNGQNHYRTQDKF